MLLSRVHHPVTVLGWGRRAGVWFQGCQIHCPSCVSRDTWDADPARAVEVDDVVAWIAGLGADEVDGVTISGGEPFDQPEALAALLDGLAAWRAARARPADVLVYSGYPLARLRARHAAVLDAVDVVVPEPFRTRRPGAALRGSDNQALVALSALGRERYDDGGPCDVAGDGPRLQVAVDDESIWYIGIPARGDMERLEARMASNGIRQEQVSWRS